MNALALMATLGLDSSEYDKGLDTASQDAGSFVSNVSHTLSGVAKTGASAIKSTFDTVGTVAKGLYNFTNDTANVLDNIDKASQKMGVARDTYQELDFILSQSGTSVETMRMGMKTLTAAMDSGSDVFNQLGIAVTNSDGSLRDQESVMWETFAALQGVENQTEKARMATQLFGRSGQELLPLLNEEAGSIEEMRQQAHDLGLIMGDDMIDAGARLNDTIDQSKRAFDAFKTRLGVSVMPVVQSAMDVFVAFASGKDISKPLKNFTKSIGTTVKNLMPMFKNAIKMIGELVKELAPVLAEELPGIITDLIPVLIDAAGNLIVAIAQNLPAILKSLWNGLKNAFSNIWEMLKTVDWIQVGKNILESILNGLKNIGAKILSLLGVPTDENGQLQLDWETLASTIGGWITGALQGARDFILGIFGVPTADENGWSSTANSIGLWIHEKLDGITTFIASLFNPPEGEDYNKIEIAWGDFGTNLANAFDTALTTASAAALGIATAAQQAVETFDWGYLGQRVGEVATQVTTVAADAASGVLTAAGNAINAFPWEEFGQNVGKLAGNVANFSVETITDGFILARQAAESFPWEETGTKLGILAGDIVGVGIDALSGVFTSASEAVASFPWAEVGTKLGILAGDFTKIQIDALSGVFTSAQSAIDTFDWAGVGQKIGNLATEATSIPITAMTGIAQSANKMLEQIDWDTLGENGAIVFDHIASTATTGLTGIFTAVESTIQAIDWVSLGNDIANGLDRAWNILGGVADIGLGMLESGVLAGQAGVANLKQGIMSLFPGAELNDQKSTVDKILTDLATIPEEIKAQMSNVESFANQLLDTLNTFITNVSTALSTMFDKTYTLSVSWPSMPDWLGNAGVMAQNPPPAGWEGRKHATAMSGGEILRGLTPFGIDSRGTMHFGGDAGAEAIVGVNSLDRMIQKSVAQSMNDVIARLGSVIGNQNKNDLKVYLDSGALVGGIVNEMDYQLNDVATWRNGGRA